MEEMRRDSTEAEVERLYDEARRNVGPRKHHLVPASYLARWAGPTGHLRVLRFESGKAHLASPANAARQTDYYRVESDDLDPDEVPPMLFETILSRVEGPAKAAVDELLEMPESIGPQARYDLATFMAFQFVRGHRTRRSLAAIAHESAKLQSLTMTEERIKQAIEARGDDATPEEVKLGLEAFQALRDDEIIVTPQDAQLIWLSFMNAAQISSVMYRRVWVVASTYPSLVTTDEPVLPIAGPGWWGRSEACGVVPAGVVAFPLAPDRVLLALRRDLALVLGLPLGLRHVLADELDLIETFGLCRELLMSASRWAFERPDRRVLDWMPIPDDPEPVSTAKYQEVDGDSELFRVFSHTRWRNASVVPDWPLEHLWPQGWRCWPMPSSLIDEAEAAVPEALRDLLGDADQ